MDAIVKIGELESTAALLLENSATPNTDLYSLRIPSYLKNQWAGKSIDFKTNGELPIKLADSKEESVLGKSLFREIPVPRIKLKSGKEQNMWSYQKYLSRSSVLNQILEPLEKQDRAEALEYILGPTIRVFGGIEWAQGAEYPKCKECHGKMKFILQVSGTWFPKTVDFDINESEIYIFGCEKHPDKLEKVVQFY